MPDVNHHSVSELREHAPMNTKNFRLVLDVEVHDSDANLDRLIDQARDIVAHEDVHTVEEAVAIYVTSIEPPVGGQWRCEASSSPLSTIESFLAAMETADLNDFGDNERNDIRRAYRLLEAIANEHA